MNRWRFGVALSLLIAISASAQSPGFVLQPGETIRESAPANDGGVWLKTRIRTGRTEHFALLKISPQSTIEFRRALPDVYERGGIIPYHDGVLALRVETPPEDDPASVQWEYRWHLDWFREDPDAPPETWYTWTDTALREDSFAVPDEAFDAVYLSRGQDDYLTKLGPDREELWRRDLREVPMRLIGMIPEGIVLLGPRQLPGDRQTSAYTVAIWSTDGSPIREMRLTLQGIEHVRDSWLLQPGTLVLQRAYSGTNQLRLEFVDIADRTLRSIELPVSVNRIEPVAEGLLVSGEALHQGILVFLDSRGDVVWTERHAFSGSFRIGRAPDPSAVGVYLFGPDRIGLTANARTGDPGPSGIRLVSVDAARSSLAASYSRCLGTDALPIAAREHQILGEFGITVRLGVDGIPSRPTDANGCELPSDADYAKFLDSFADELTLRDFSGFNRYEVDIRIGVDAIGDAFEVRRYQVNCPATDCVNTNIGLAANAAAGRSLAAHVTLELAPHLGQMRARVDEYFDVTGCQLSVSFWTIPVPVVNAAHNYRQAEQSMSAFISGAKNIMAGIPSPQRDPRIGCGSVVSLNGLGVPVTPLSELLDLLRVRLSGPQ